MKYVILVAAIGLIAMGAVLIYGFTAGDFGGEGRQLLAMPWGIVSLVDLYTGFILFSGWILYREKSWLQAAGWVLLMLVLGFFAGSLYTLVAALSSRGDWRRFWLGRHA